MTNNWTLWCTLQDWKNNETQESSLQMTSKSAQGVLAGKIWLAIFCKCEKVYQVGLSSGLSLLAWVLFASFLSASVIHLRFQRDVVLPSLHYVEGRFGTNIHSIHLFQFYIFRSIPLFLCKFTKMGVVPSVDWLFHSPCRDQQPLTYHIWISTN